MMRLPQRCVHVLACVMAQDCNTVRLGASRLVVRMGGDSQARTPRCMAMQRRLRLQQALALVRAPVLSQQVQAAVHHCQRQPRTVACTIPMPAKQRSSWTL